MSDFADPQEIELLIRDKYNSRRSEENEVAIAKDIERLACGEPLAYVIGWTPFLDLRISLATPSGLPEHPEIRALIPRPETEWWTEKLIAHLKEKFADGPFTLLDLCAGSGAIGLAVLKACPNARVTFADIVPELTNLIRENVRINNLDEARATILQSNLYESLQDQQFDIIATNPPYIPQERPLDSSVVDFEPHEALFGGPDGLALINRILEGTAEHLTPAGEVWMECDVDNIYEAEQRASACGARAATVHQDPYGRPRLLVSHF